MNNREYTPDCWVVVKITHEEETYYKVAAGWSGGYLHGNSWRMNSGITEVKEDDNHWYFFGASGSVYKCHKERYGVKISNAPAIEHIKAATASYEVMDEETNWKELNYEKHTTND